MLARFWIVLGLGMTCLSSGVRGQEWGQFRGPGGSGVSADKQPQEWAADKNVQWKMKIPGVAWSSPVVWGDKVFVTTAVTDNQRKPPRGGGFGGGGFGGRPRPGELIPAFLRGSLNLTDDQKKQLDSLQKDVDGKLGKLLTAEQNKQLKDPPAAPGGGRPGGFGRGGFGGMPQPGQVLSQRLQEQLKLTDPQKKQLVDLQKDVDEKLAKLLTADQSKRLKAPGGGFGRGGPGGFGRGGFGGGRPPDQVYRWKVYCLDRATGKILWQQVALEGKPRTPIQQSNTYATETPVTDGERIYAYFGMHGLFCYDTAGKLVWKKDFGAYPTMMGYGSASSPVLDGDRLFLQIDNEEKSFVVALNKKTGDELWRASRDERTNHCTPLVWKNQKRTELVTCGSKKVRSYDPANGKVLWELPLGGGRCYASPVGDAERLYVGCGRSMGGFGGGRGGPGGGPGGMGGGGGGLYAVKAGASGDLTLKTGETTNAGVAWSQRRASLDGASPLAYQNYLYVLSQNGGLVTCYDAKTGKEVYRERLPNARSFWASPWASGGKIYCLDDGGTTYVLQAGPEFKVLGKNTIDDQFWASPAMAGGTLILRGLDNLYCIKPQD